MILYYVWRVCLKKNPKNPSLFFEIANLRQLAYDALDENF